MKAIVCGGRDYKEFQVVAEILEEFMPELIIHGDARGADTIASLVAQQLGIYTVKVPALWEKLGNAAGPRRNQFMIDLGVADTLIAFPGGRGTEDMTMRAIKAGLEVIQIKK